jgi:hypothetical protein
MGFSECVFARLYLVRPPNEASTSTPVSAKASYTAQRVALTASFAGLVVLCLARRCGRTVRTQAGRVSPIG